MQHPAPVAVPNSLALVARSHEFELTSIPIGDVAWSLTDIGPVHGAILVERLRTFGGQCKDLSLHCDRLSIGAKQFGLDTENLLSTFELICQRLVKDNTYLASCDASLVFLVSPVGNRNLGQHHRAWRAIGYLSPLPIDRLKCWYEKGAALFSTEYHVIPNDIFPTSIKHRSRIHYWLADESAKADDPLGLALLESADGYLGDTSVANVILVTHDDRWQTPTAHHAHIGTTLKRSSQLLELASIQLEYRDIRCSELLEAKEVLLTGSTGVVWRAASLNKTRLGDGQTRATQLLQSLWKEYLAFDFLHAIGLGASNVS